jgi:hypothetical protein
MFYANENEYNLTLPSNASSSLYKNNTPSVFSIKLPTPLILEGDWQVAATSVQYPFSWYNLTKEATFLVAVPTSLPNNQKFEHSSLSPGQPPSDFEALAKSIIRPIAAFYTYFKSSIPAGYYNSARDLAQNIVSTYMASIEKSLCKVDLVYKQNEFTDRITFSTSEKADFIFITDSKELLRMLGAKYEQLGLHYEHLYFSLEYNFGKYPPQTDSTRSIYVTTDMIPHQQFGDNQKQILGIIPFLNEEFSQRFFVFDPPNYTPVTKKTIDMITINMLDENWLPMKFNSGNVILNLHFRKSSWNQ